MLVEILVNTTWMQAVLDCFILVWLMYINGKNNGWIHCSAALSHLKCSFVMIAFIEVKQCLINLSKFIPAITGCSIHASSLSVNLENVILFHQAFESIPFRNRYRL